MENLAKEIITTTTEKYNEEGVIQEKITEVKERTYTVEPKTSKKEEEDNDASQGGAADNSATPSIKQEDIVKAAQQVLQQQQHTPVYTPTSTYQSPTTPQYNVVGRQTGGASGTTFPWETPGTY